jgi:hypothetical protein
MAGLLAARALSDQYDEVVLFERDKLLDSAEPRKVAPQALFTSAAGSLPLLDARLTRGR